MISPLNKDEFMEQMKKSENAGDYSENAAKRFWYWMYSDEEGLVQICTFPMPTENKSKSEMGEGKWIHARSFNEFNDFCKTHSGLWRYHVYAGVNMLDTIPEYGRGSVEHIDKVHRLSFDIETQRDSYSGASKEEVWWSYRYALAQAKFMLEEYEVLPLMIMSENGIHMHYKVSFNNSKELLDGKQHMYCKYITHQAMNSSYVQEIEEKAPNHITFDQDEVSDPPRVMKVPGTRGIKSENGRLCGIIHEPNLSDAGIISGEDMEVTQEDIDGIEERNNGSSDTTQGVDTSPGDLGSETMEKVRRLAKNDEAFGKYWSGNIGEYKSRSEAEFAFVIKMLNHGFTELQIVDVMWASGMSKWEEESDHYRERTIQRAIEYFDGTVVKDSKDGSFNF